MQRMYAKSRYNWHTVSVKFILVWCRSFLLKASLKLTFKVCVHGMEAKEAGGKAARILNFEPIWWWCLVPYLSLSLYEYGTSKCTVGKKSKVKESRNRPGVFQRVPGGLGSQISLHSVREGDEVVSLTHRPPLPPGMFLVLIFTRGWVDPRAMERSEGDMSMKNKVTPPGIDPGTVRLVAQRLNHYATPGPVWKKRSYYICIYIYIYTHVTKT
jgi:hypothetical protein